MFVVDYLSKNILIQTTYNITHNISYNISYNVCVALPTLFV
ncbi:hypothetical protein CG405_02055 [Gardnerella vaginalis]|uniref:Uncharacterized protein n=1 Tax=Gardnerella vaginalis TaxID=2702 RepID=A0A3E2CCS3_GARVA|nr:hypothetical protein CYJ66_01600 [Gardnerella vaginalis]PKZ55598.1 hypothetical protein CYJ64_01600 [Gardnerella vaginalis]PKZ57144.1 hypothetical protein CYJ63_04010 [Gardnerella vaginalis]PKZ73974.1 hypothetical protein CYJ65_01590 [Gardnerella vaginalis]RFT29552.1 hypothetical protein CG405_02055 [Gardnerella vaginalis]